jgi:hypothetical protein
MKVVKKAPSAKVGSEEMAKKLRRLSWRKTSG